jgi:PncC family amidohydrolase
VKGLATRVTDRLAERGMTLAVAESCTGGLLAAVLTEQPGASRYFSAGLVTYSDDAKARILGVRPETIAAYGAVSERVAREMATGALRAAGVDAALAITGIAGPGGGTPEKPVGTVWIAVALGDNVRADVHRFPGDRAQVREQSARAALELLERRLGEEP